MRIETMGKFAKNTGAIVEALSNLASIIKEEVDYTIDEKAITDIEIAEKMQTLELMKELSTKIGNISIQLIDFNKTVMTYNGWPFSDM